MHPSPGAYSYAAACGKVIHEPVEKCPSCKGLGWVPACSEAAMRNQPMGHLPKCRACDGTGKVKRV
jgi:hypothetical protein